MMRIQQDTNKVFQVSEIRKTGYKMSMDEGR